MICLISPFTLWFRITTKNTLGLAEMELTFPMATLTLLGWALVATKVLMSLQCFSSCWAELTQHQLYLSKFSHFTLLAGGGKDLGQGHSQDIWPKDYPTSYGGCWAVKPKRKEAEGGIHYYCACLLKKSQGVLKSCFPGSCWTLLNDGK